MKKTTQKKSQGRNRKQMRQIEINNKMVHLKPTTSVIMH